MLLMRVLLCKIHIPSSICFCKPSPHIYTAGPLKLENTTHISSTTIDSAKVETHVGVDYVDGNGNEVEEESRVDGKKEESQSDGNKLKSSLKKTDLSSSEVENKEEKKKKNVQWVDSMGKELVEIREFEPSDEEEDASYNGSKSCVCAIL